MTARDGSVVAVSRSSASPPRTHARSTPPRMTLDALDPSQPSIRVYRRGDGRRMHAVGPHTHEFFVLLYCTVGTGTLELAHGQIALGPGDVHFLFPGEMHDMGGMLHVEGWAVEFTGDALTDGGELSGYFGSARGRSRWARCLGRHDAESRAAHIPAERQPSVVSLVTDLERELRERPMAYREAARARLQLLLVELLRLTARSGVQPILSPVVEEALAVIDLGYTDAISLADVARSVSRSPAHVAHAVREETGRTVLDWITERRLNDARRRLRDTDEDVAIIAERVGYGSINHFIRQFRRVHGATPGAWRKAQRQQVVVRRETSGAHTRELAIVTTKSA